MNQSPTSTETAPAAIATANPVQDDGIISLPGIESMMTGVSYFRFPFDGKTLTAVYTDGTSETCATKHDTMILLLAIHSCVRQDKALPDFSSFALVSEVQSHRQAA